MEIFGIISKDNVKWMRGDQILNINIDGLNIHYIDEGEGEPLLMLHGWGASCQSYRGIIDAVKHKYRCIALDFPGCGQSDVMKNPWTLEDYVILVKKFIDTLSLENPIMFGHSHGGRVTLKMAAEGIVSPKKIILLDSAGLIPKKTAKQKWRAGSFKAIKRVLTLPPLAKPCAGLLDRARAHYGSADYNAAPPVLRQTLVSLVNTDIRDILPRITASTLLIWGEKDTATPLSDAKIIEKSIKDCGLCVIPNTGHWSFVENPAMAHAIIRNFLGA